MIGDALLWTVAGGALGVAVAFATATWRKDLDLQPLHFALTVAFVAAAASVICTQIEQLCLVVLLTVLAVSDFRLRILPNELTYGLAITGVVFAIAGPRDPLIACLGAFVGGSALWALRAIWLRLIGQEALGLGDAKMLAGIGAFVGPSALPELVFWAATGGLVLALVDVKRNGTSNPEIPFGTAMAASCWFYTITGPVLFIA